MRAVVETVAICVAFVAAMSLAFMAGRIDVEKSRNHQRGIDCLKASERKSP